MRSTALIDPTSWPFIFFLVRDMAKGSSHQGTCTQTKKTCNTAKRSENNVNDSKKLWNNR